MPNPDPVTELKNKVIDEFTQLLTYLEKGHKTNYELILEEISLINLIDEGEIDSSLSYLEFYLNNKLNTKWITF
jgi:regulator of sigma D